MRIVKTIAAVILLAGMGWAGFDSAYGPLDSPNARVLRHTEFALGVSSFLVPLGHPGSRIIGPNLSSQNLDYEWDGWFEVGLFGYVQAGARMYDPQTFSADIKALIYKETSSIPSFAVGLMNIGGGPNIGPYGIKETPYGHPQNNSIYLVATKTMESIVGIPLLINVGVGSGRFQGEWHIAKHHEGVFSSLQWFATDYISAIIESDSRDLNAGLIVKLPQGFTATLGIGEIEQAFWGQAISPLGPGTADEYDEPKLNLALQFNFGPIVGGPEAERQNILRKRISTAEIKLKMMEDRRKAIDIELEEIRRELYGK
jgi:hypothetical protein